MAHMDREERESRRRRSGSRDRERYRSRTRSRSQSRSRSRSRERSRERRRERDDDRYSRRRRYDDSRREGKGRDYDDGDDDRDNDYDDRRERYRDRWRSEDDRIEQSPVVMLRNLNDSIRKDDITYALGDTMSYVKDIRLIQRGESRSFAFVEFLETEHAVKWMNENKGTLKILDSPVNVEFSRHKRLGLDGSRDRSYGDSRDWVCFKCRTMNFARRRLCMTCDCPRSESESLHEDVRQGRIDQDDREGEREENNPPSNVLILRGLDALSTESSIRTAISSLSSVSLKDIRLIRDKSTNTSRGFCFVELVTIEEAKQLLEKVRNEYPAFFVDGRRVSVNYARQNSSSSGSKSAASSVASAAIAQAQWSMKQQTGSWKGQQQSLPQVQSSGTWPQTHVAQNSYNSTETVAQQAYQQGATDAKGQQSKVQEKGSSDEFPSTYSYDPTSGFYYDSATGLYYDPKTQYHYNNQTGQYCYYNATQQMYIPVSSDGTPVSSANTTDASTTKAEKKKKDGNVEPVAVAGGSKSAKKIAKDMARWAKSVNAAKNVQQQQLQALIHLEKAEAQAVQSSSFIAPQTTLGAGLQYVAGGGGEVERIAEMRRSGVALSAALEREDTIDRSALSALAAEVSDLPVVASLPPGADPNPAHTDWKQLACLLCKRKFPSREVLVKHQQFSDLHKQNLEKERKALMAPIGPAPSEGSEIKYRDRAKERRDKFGLPEAIVPGWKRRLDKEFSKPPPIPYEQPTMEGIKEDNIGNKMLKSMGWSKGQGLGKAKQGITEPIKAEMRQASAGLGAPGSAYRVYSNPGNYKDTLKQLTRARFDEAFQQ